jgi:hypothetical protein
VAGLYPIERHPLTPYSAFNSADKTIGTLTKRIIQMTISTIQQGLIAAVAVLMTGCSTLFHQEVFVPWETLPTAVQSTILSHKHGGTIGKVEQLTKRNGLVYKALVSGEKGQQIEIKVAPDGKLLSFKAWNETHAQSGRFGRPFGRWPDADSVDNRPRVRGSAYDLG